MKPIISYDDRFLWGTGKGSLSKKDFHIMFRTKGKKAVEQVKKDLSALPSSIFSLPFSDTTSVEALALQMKKVFTHIIVIGIGGSDLGARAILQAIPASESSPKMIFLSNPDPDDYKEQTHDVPWKTTGVLVVCKSGKTLETTALFLRVRAHLQQALGNIHASHIFVLTQTDGNPLHLFAKESGYTILPHADIGGRFAVLSSVGLLPAALVGISIHDLLKGAGDVIEDFTQQGIKHPVAHFTAVQYFAYSKGKTQHVLMPYSQRLSFFTQWFRQLWAESLGKTLRGRGVGPTPIAAMGTIDQHSQIQLFNDGPKNKAVTFLELNRFYDTSKSLGPSSRFPKAFSASLKSFTDILHASRLGTAQALHARGCPNGTLLVPQLDSYHLGALFLFFELATILYAKLLGVNPYDQPGVEKGKLNIRKILSSP
jgi:glucose-6-phosphate isomerase